MAKLIFGTKSLKYDVNMSTLIFTDCPTECKMVHTFTAYHR
jgi:hypothetical protein